MKYASLTERTAGDSADAWSVHGRAAERKRRGEDVILLSIGDPDFETPHPIVARALESLRQGRTHYTPAAGIMALREVVARYHTRTTGQPVDSDNVMIVPGAQCGLFCAAMCVVEHGDEILVPEPMYVTYEGVAGATGANLVPVPLRPENEFHLDPSDLERAIGPRSRALLINTPHNPTGTVMRRETLEAIAELAQAHDLWVIADEVYRDVTFEVPPLSPASVEPLEQRCATVFSLSKAFAMTGWRLGWVVAPRELAGHIERLLACMLYGSPPFIQDAAIEALASERPEVGEMRNEYRARRDLVCARLTQVPRIACHRPEAGMYIMIDVRGTGLSGKDFANALLDHGGVSLLPGEGFGPSGAGHVRLGLCAPRDTLREACLRIERFVAEMAGPRVKLG